jgi:LmbE family N-acetylglucosaminyl deacetylase
VRVDELGTVLGVWAHPDDEAYLSAGLMAEARASGQRVVVATATYGELGASDPYQWSPARLATTRRHELAASLAAVGVTEHRWLGFGDGECHDRIADGTAAVVRLIDEVAPDTILTFGPEGMTGHPDHQAISRWTTDAWRSTASPARLLYATKTPQFHQTWGEINDRLGIWMFGAGPSTAESDLLVDVHLTDSALDRKVVALRAHASQTTALLQAVGLDQFGRWCSTESFVAATTMGQPVPGTVVTGTAR